MIGRILGALSFGGLMLVGSVCLLGWNEWNYLKQAKTIASAEKALAVSDLDSSKVDSQYEGKLVHTSGKVKTEETLRDNLFGIEQNAIRLQRAVTMYQYDEDEIKDEDGNVERYEYDPGWYDRYIDSGNFHNANMRNSNPPMPFTGETQDASKVTLGAFSISPRLKGLIRGSKALPLTEEMLVAIPDNFHGKSKIVDNGVLYVRPHMTASHLNLPGPDPMTDPMTDPNSTDPMNPDPEVSPETPDTDPGTTDPAEPSVDDLNLPEDDLKLPGSADSSFALPRSSTFVALLQDEPVDPSSPTTGEQDPTVDPTDGPTVGEPMDPEVQPETDAEPETQPETMPTEPTTDPNGSGGFQSANFDTSSPQIGDIKVVFSIVPNEQDVSVIAAQTGSSLGPFKTPFRDYEDLDMGKVDSVTMFSRAKSENNMMLWICRIIGVVLSVVGIRIAFSAVTGFTDAIPFLGGILGWGATIGAVVLGVPIALLTIAIAWVIVRPLVGILMLVVVIGLFVLGFYFLKSAQKDKTVMA